MRTKGACTRTPLLALTLGCIFTVGIGAASAANAPLASQGAPAYVRTRSCCGPEARRFGVPWLERHECSCPGRVYACRGGSGRESWGNRTLSSPTACRVRCIGRFPVNRLHALQLAVHRKPTLRHLLYLRHHQRRVGLPVLHGLYSGFLADPRRSASETVLTDEWDLS